MTIHCLIVDDEAKSANALAKTIRKHIPELKILGIADSAFNARREIIALQPDLVFLDVEMPGADGFSLLEDIEEVNFELVFVTAHEQYALRAFRCAALDYLLKPVSAADIREAVGRAIHRATVARNSPRRLRLLGEELRGESQSLALPTIDGFEFVKIQDVLRCKAESNYTRIFMRGGREILTPRSLGEYEEILEGRSFARIHHSCIVNLNHVRKYRKGRGGVIVMSDGAEIDVAQRRKESFLQQFTH